METLRTQDYYVLALEKNLALLASFRQRLGDGFERLPFGVQRQLVLAFVDGLRVRERREVAIHLKLTLDNDGIEHLCDELEAVDRGASTESNDGDGTKGGGFGEADAPYGQSDPRWRPFLDRMRTRLLHAVGTIQGADACRWLSVVDAGRAG